MFSNPMDAFVVWFLLMIQMGGLQFFAVGAAVGAALTVGLFAFTRRSYRRVLTLKATSEHRTPEKLLDGKFYYLVEENEYSDLKRGVQLQQEPVGYITTDAVGVLRKRLNPIRSHAEHLWHKDGMRRRATVPVYLERRHYDGS
jgi:hypothetical protein